MRHKNSRPAKQQGGNSTEYFVFSTVYLTGGTSNRERLCIFVLREYLRHLRIWQLRDRPEKPGDPIHPRFAEAMKALPTVNHLLDCLLGNDLLLARQTAEVLCREGYLRRLSEYLGTLSEKERDCA